jgi:hypothetical protein
VGLVRALQAAAVQPAVIAVEVISHDLVGQGVDVAAHTAAAREVPAAAR